MRCYLFVLVLMISLTSVRSQTQSNLLHQSLSQKYSYSVQFWNTENGLPQNTVRSIEQTPNKLIWFATHKGLVRFDGYSFEVENRDSNPMFSSSFVLQVKYVPEKEELYVVSEDQVLIYSQEGTLKSTIDDIQLWYIEPSNSGRVYALGVDGFMYEIVGDQLEKKVNEPVFGFAVVGDEVYAVIKKRLYTLVNDHWEPEPSDIEVDSKIFSNGNRLFFTSGNSLYQYVDHNPLPIFETEYAIELTSLRTYNDEILIGTSNGFFLKKGEKLEFYDEASGLANSDIGSILRDVDGNIWLGTMHSGLHFLKKKSFMTITEDFGLMQNEITAIYERSNGDVYVGFTCGGYAVIRNLKDDFFADPIMRDSLCVWSFHEDKEGNMLVGTYGGGVYLETARGELTEYAGKKEAFCSPVALSMYELTTNELLVGTSQGLTRISKAGVECISEGFQVSTIEVLSDGRVLLGTKHGLKEYISNEVIEVIPEIDVRAIHEDGGGSLWIGTYGEGLYCLSGDDLFHFPVELELLPLDISTIVDDKKGAFWMTSNNGLYMVKENSLNKFMNDQATRISGRIFHRDDGIVNTEFNGGFQSSGCRTSSGLLLFPSIHGVVVVNPLELKSSVRSNPMINKFIVNGVEKDELIAEKGNLIEVTFTYPQFNKSESTYYQYFLKGFSTEWSSPQVDRWVRFSNLDPGKYEFLLRASNYEGVPLSEEISLSFEVTNSPWKDFLYILPYILLTLLLVLVVAMIWVRRIKKKEAEKTHFNKLLAEVELKALQSQLNPHFIFNCLNSIQHFVLENDEISANKYLGTFSRLMRVVLEHSKRSTVTLREEIDLLKMYVELEKLRFGDKFEYKFVISDQLNLDRIIIPGMLFQPHVENALEHGLSGLDVKGELTVSFEVKDDCLFGVVEDNGIGRKASAAKKKEAEHRSRGTEISNERIKALNYLGNHEISMRTIDLDKNGNTGTRVEILCKLVEL